MGMLAQVLQLLEVVQVQILQITGNQTQVAAVTGRVMVAAVL
jgi:hypothetical protein